jgi:hypothetical protein
VNEVARVVEHHDHHHNAAQQINRINASVHPVNLGKILEILFTSRSVVLI